MEALLVRHHEIVHQVIRDWGGVPAPEVGDLHSTAGTFLSVSDALRAAVDAERALHRQLGSEVENVVARTALHTGELEVREDGTLSGSALVRCTHLGTLAHGGQILVSGAAAEVLGDDLPAGVSLLPLGVHRLRDRGRPQRVFQLVHPDLPAQFPPLRSLGSLPNNLPAQPTTFVGREAELRELDGLVGRARLVTLVGAGGSGKSRLAAQVAADVGDAYPDGVWWVDFAPLADPVRVPHALLAVLGVGDLRNRDPLDRVADQLADRRVLLVLDNCEHVLRAAAVLLDALRSRNPGLVAVATSREPLGLPGELVWTVEPMSLPPEGEASSFEQLDRYDALRLFVDRALSALPTFRMDDKTLATVTEICRHVDGLPLGIELAAARLKSLTPRHLLEGLADRFRLLTGGARTALPRQQTLEASLEWSYHLLDEPERVLLRRLSVFSGGFTLEAVEEICSGGLVMQSDALPLLARLVEKSLVVFDVQAARYSTLQTVHEFATRRLLDAAEAEAVRDRHAAFFLAQAEAASAELERAPSPEPLSAIEHDHDNLRRTLQWTLSSGDDEGALRLVVALTPFWTIRGHYSEAQDWCRRVLREVPDGPLSLRCRATWSLGHLGLCGMDLGGGLGIAETAEAVELADRLADEALAARASVDQGLLQIFAAPDSAPVTLERAVAAARRAGDDWALGMGLAFLALFWILDRDDLERARPALDEVAGLERNSGSLAWRGWHGMGAGLAAWRQGNLVEARVLLETGVDAAHALGDPMLEAYCMFWLVDVRIAQGHYSEAASLTGASLERLSRSARVREEFVALRLAVLALAQGQLAESRRATDAILPLARMVGLSLLLWQCLIVLGKTALAESRLEEAELAVKEAAALAAALESPWSLAETHNLAGRLAVARDDPGAAEDLYHAALALVLEHGFAGLAAETLEALAGLAGGGESHAEAARLLAAAEALRETTGQRRWPLDQPAHDAWVSLLRDQLGDQEFARVWGEGRNLTLAEAAAYASRARGERKRPSTGWAALTPTELEVVAFAAQGCSNAEIGRRLFISPATAKTHLAHVYRKLGLANRAQLAALATARGIGDRSHRPGERT